MTHYSLLSQDPQTWGLRLDSCPPPFWGRSCAHHSSPGENPVPAPSHSPGVDTLTWHHRTDVGKPSHSVLFTQQTSSSPSHRKHCDEMGLCPEEAHGLMGGTVKK